MQSSFCHMCSRPGWFIDCWTACLLLVWRILQADQTTNRPTFHPLFLMLRYDSSVGYCTPIHVWWIVIYSSLEGLRCRLQPIRTAKANWHARKKRWSISSLVVEFAWGGIRDSYSNSNHPRVLFFFLMDLICFPGSLILPLLRPRPPFTTAMWCAPAQKRVWPTALWQWTTLAVPMTTMLASSVGRVSDNTDHPFCVTCCQAWMKPITCVLLISLGTKCI